MVIVRHGELNGTGGGRAGHDGAVEGGHGLAFDFRDQQAHVAGNGLCPVVGGRRHRRRS